MALWSLKYTNVIMFYKLTITRHNSNGLIFLLLTGITIKSIKK
jgi:hypothetical protein